MFRVLLLGPILEFDGIWSQIYSSRSPQDAHSLQIHDCLCLQARCSLGHGLGAMPPHTVRGSEIPIFCFLLRTKTAMVSDTSERRLLRATTARSLPTAGAQVCDARVDGNVGVSVLRLSTPP